MKLWLCTIADSPIVKTNLGIFSSDKGAENQIKIFMDGIGEMYEEIDRDTFDGTTHIFYRTISSATAFTAIIEEFTLDEISY